MLPMGKLPPDLLAHFLHFLDVSDPSLVVGPSVGEDAAVIDLGEQLLVVKTDPITFATDAIGWYLVCINGNDIATMGAVPRWLLTTVLLPEGTSPDLAEGIFEQLRSACQHFSITLCGGHTEVTYRLDRPILVGCMLGTLPRGALVTSAGAQVGDALLLTGGMGIEATSVIARERVDELAVDYSEEWIQTAQNFLFDPGISILGAARIAVGMGGVHAMHDPTEGGVATALHEIATCAEVGVRVWSERLFASPTTLELCERYGLEPMGVLSSGALLLAVAADKVADHLAAFRDRGIQAAHVGEIVPREEGVCLYQAGKESPLPLFVADEITRIYARDE